MCSYVYYLESRVSYLESLLGDSRILFEPPEDFIPSSSTVNGQAAKSDDQPPVNSSDEQGCSSPTRLHKANATSGPDDNCERERLNKLVSNIGMVSVQGASDPRFLGSASGISFARVVFAAVKSSVAGASSERGSVRPGKPLPGAVASGGTSMRDSFFGLHTKPTLKPATFPDRELGLRLVELYFEHANPQIPILHRGEFMSMFERVHASDERNQTARELYMLNIVFAIGAGIVVDSSSPARASPGSDESHSPVEAPLPPSNRKKRRLSSYQHQPEEYHASAVVHLESLLGSGSAADRPDGVGGGLEELQAVLLLAGFALLRPVAPGLWYIVGVAVRLGVDLGLHHEDGADIDDSPVDEAVPQEESGVDVHASKAAAAETRLQRVNAQELGRRQWVRDLRRRLWWCVYSLDRLVSTCVGRPSLQACRARCGD